MFVIIFVHMKSNASESKVRLNTKLGKLYEWWGCGKFLPSATVVAERLCSHRCLSVHGGCTPSWQANTPLAGRHPPGRQIPPLGKHPPGRYPPQADGYCSRRYTSYWNAFLFLRSGVAKLFRSELAKGFGR